MVDDRQVRRCHPYCGLVNFPLGSKVRYFELRTSAYGHNRRIKPTFSLNAVITKIGETLQLVSVPPPN